MSDKEPNFYAFVRCSGIDPSIGGYSCGDVGLTEEQYSAQMNLPDYGWRCPNCGAPADYLDAQSEKAQEAFHGR